MGNFRINMRLTSDFYEPFTPTHILDLLELPGGCGPELAQGKGRIRNLTWTSLSSMGNKEVVGFFAIKVLDKYFAFYDHLSGN